MRYILQKIIEISKIILHIFITRFQIKTFFQLGVARKYFETDITKFLYFENGSGYYLADPFILSHDGHDYIFCEKYIQDKGKGIIQVFEIDNDFDLIDLGIALEESFHLSFPFIFQFEESIYMIPESKSVEKIILYKNVEWPNKWNSVSILLDGVKAVDTVVFRHNEIWWLLTTFDSAGTNLSQSELHIYYSLDLESENWTKHSMNPVLIDSYKGRNAGFFLDGKKLIRCSQSMKNFRYGRNLNFHEIVNITEHEYQETDLDLGIFDNCHSYDSKNHFTVLDIRN